MRWRRHLNQFQRHEQAYSESLKAEVAQVETICSSPKGAVHLHHHPATNHWREMERVAKSAGRWLPLAGASALAALADCLEDERLRWFVALMVKDRPRIPHRLFDPLIRAAVILHHTPDDARRQTHPIVSGICQC